MATVDRTSLESFRRSLGNCVLFREIVAVDKDALLSRARLRRFGAGETIFLMGSPGDSMMAVLSGNVRISVPAVDGREIVLAILHENEVFGEIAMLDGKPRSADATALTKCELLLLERRHVIPFLEQNPAMCLKLMEMLCARIRHSDERMADIAFFDLPTRLAKVLLNYPAKTRDDTRL